MKKLFKNNVAASAIEIAIILPVFMFLIISLIETSMYIYTDMEVQKASKEAVREASLGKDRDAVENKLETRLGEDLYKTVDGSEYDEKQKDKQMVQWGIKSFPKGIDDEKYQSFIGDAAENNFDSIIYGKDDIGGSSNSGKIAVFALCHRDAQKLNLTRILPSTICTWNITRYENYSSE